MLQVWVWTLFFKFLNLTILNFGTPFQIQEFLGQVRISSLDNILSLDLSVVTKWAKLGITLKDLKNLILGQVWILSLNTVSSLDFSVVVKWAKLGIISKDLKNLILGQVRIPSLDTISSLDFSVVVKWAKLGITSKDLENLIFGQVWIASLDTISSLEFNVVIKWAKLVSLQEIWNFLFHQGMISWKIWALVLCEKICLVPRFSLSHVYCFHLDFLFW